MSILQDSPPLVNIVRLVLEVERADEAASIHEAACRYRRQGLRCATCTSLNERVARLARLAGEDEEWGPDSATQQLERGPR
jgi:hypothetical protein